MRLFNFLTGALVLMAPVYLSAATISGVCNVSDLTVDSVSATYCAGAFTGNEDGSHEGTALAAMAEAFHFDAADWFRVGSSDQVPPKTTSGTVTFDSLDSLVNGPFVITLKASNKFSAYYFDGPFDGAQNIVFKTNGTAWNSNDIPSGLSHAGLWSGRLDVCAGCTPGQNDGNVPEPATFLLIGVGLSSLGIVRKLKTN